MKEPKISKLKEDSDFVVKEKNDNISLFNDELIGGSLSMTSVFVG